MGGTLNRMFIHIGLVFWGVMWGMGTKTRKTTYPFTGAPNQNPLLCLCMPLIPVYSNVPATFNTCGFSIWACKYTFPVFCMLWFVFTWGQQTEQWWFKFQLVMIIASTYKHYTISSQGERRGERTSPISTNIRIGPQSLTYFDLSFPEASSDGIESKLVMFIASTCQHLTILSQKEGPFTACTHWTNGLVAFEFHLI